MVQQAAVCPQLLSFIELSQQEEDFSTKKNQFSQTLSIAIGLIITIIIVVQEHCCNWTTFQITSNSKKLCFFLNVVLIARKIPDRSIVFIIQPKIFDLHVFLQYANMDIFCFDLQNWQKNFRFTTCTKHVNQQRVGHQIFTELKKCWICLIFFQLLLHWINANLIKIVLSYFIF